MTSSIALWLAIAILLGRQFQMGFFFLIGLSTMTIAMHEQMHYGAQ
jgi:hypothetical protein